MYSKINTPKQGKVIQPNSRVVPMESYIDPELRRLASEKLNQMVELHGHELNFFKDLNNKK